MLVQSIPYPASGGSGYRAYRFVPTGANFGSSWNVPELEMAAYTGGPDIIPAQTGTSANSISGGSILSGSAWTVFDDSASTQVALGTDGTGYVGWDFGTATPLNEIRYLNPTGPGGIVTTGHVDGSANLSTWIKITDFTLAGTVGTGTITLDANPVPAAPSGGYRYYFLEILTTGNGFIGASTIKLLDGSSVDHALSSAGAAAAVVGYTVNASFPVSNVNDGNDSTFTTSSGAGASGSGHGIVIDMGSAVPAIAKVGFRSRSDSFGAAEAVTSGRIYGKVNAGDAWSFRRAITETGWSSNEYREWVL